MEGRLNCMKKVQVLMSTYNGEKYIKEQIESILNQSDVEVHLIVRDDGSSDKTVEIIRNYNDVKLIESKNLGVTKSFFELIKVAEEYDFYAFADQDDVWDEDKLKTAVQTLELYSCPAIYSGNTRLVDSDLKYIKNETLRPITTLGSALVKNYVTGCTTVFNNSLMSYLKSYTPNYAVCHDWWVNLVCLSIGGVSVYDYEPHMNYRQHGNNVVSGNDSNWKKWKSRLKKFINSPYHREIMAKEIIDNYAVLIKKEEEKVLTSMINRKYTVEMSTGSTIDNILFRICLALGRQ